MKHLVNPKVNKSEICPEIVVRIPNHSCGNGLTFMDFIKF